MIESTFYENTEEEAWEAAERWADREDITAFRLKEKVRQRAGWQWYTSYTFVAVTHDEQG